jgi:hypothetical protein
MSIEIIEIARRRASVVAVFAQWIQERPFQVALDFALRHAQEINLPMSVKDWVAIFRAHGIDTLDDYCQAKGSFTVIGLGHFQEFERKMTALDWPEKIVSATDVLVVEVFFDREANNGKGCWKARLQGKPDILDAGADERQAIANFLRTAGHCGFSSDRASYSIKML